MHKKNKNLFATGLFFISSSYLSFTMVNLFYLSIEAPDFIFYRDYFDYFFGNIDTTGRENGLLYFYLVSLAVSAQEYLITPLTENHIISNSIQIINFTLYSIGLLGLFKLAVLKKYSRENIFIVFATLNFLPFTINMIVTMKPEVIAFSILPWCFLSIEKYIETNHIKYLYFIIFPNIILLTTKATIIASVVLVYLFIFYRNYQIFLNFNMVKLSVLFLFLTALILNENYVANGYFILDHSPGGGGATIPLEERVKLDFLYNINFIDLIQKPYRHNHANSLVGLILLDTFGDYFQWYANNSRTLFYIDRVNLSGFWYFVNVREVLALMLSLIFYFYIFFTASRKRELKIYLLLPLASIFIFCLSVFIRAEYFDTSRAELFKTHYYSYLLIISFTFVLLNVVKDDVLKKVLLSCVIIFISLYLHGFPKKNFDDIKTYLGVKNTVSQLCELNTNLLRIKTDPNCQDFSRNICLENVFLSDVRYIKTLNDETAQSIYPLNLLAESKAPISVSNSSECEKFINDGYGYVSKYSKNIKTPVLNIIYYLFALASLFYISKKE